MPRLHYACAGLAALLAASPALARAEAEQPVDEVLVTATRAPGGIEADRIGGSATVISAEDMTLRQVRIVSDVLRDVPGVAVGRTGAVGGLTQLRVRGTEGNHVLTLIDGIKASDPFQGEFDYGALIADEAAKVEVLRGQQSALYGSDAIGGVVNYITLSGREDPGASLRVEGGSMGTYEAAARVGGVSGGLDYVLSAGLHHTDGYPVATIGTRDIGARIGTVSAKVAYDLGEAVTLKAVARHVENKADSNGQDFFTGFVTDAPGTSVRSNNTYAAAGLDYRLAGGAWTGGFLAQGTDARRKTYSSYVRDGGDVGKRARLSFTSSYRIEAGGLTHTFTGAADYERESYRNTAPASPFGPDLTKRTVHTTGLVGQYDLSGGRWGLRGALRHDSNSDFRDATTYRVEAYVQVVEHLRLRAAAGSGVKAPGQTELFGYNASAFPFVGNPDLKPEKSEGWEVGGDLTFADGRARLSATWFDSTLHDEIATIFTAPVALCTVPGKPVPFACSTTVNLATRSKQRGVELSGRLRLTDAFRLDAAYTWLDAKQDGLREIRRPKTTASLNATWRPIEKASLTATVRYNGRMIDTDFATFRNVPLKAYTLVNLGAAYAVNDRIEVYGRIENLTDEDYYDVLYFRTPGRAAYAGVRLRF